MSRITFVSRVVLVTLLTFFLPMTVAVAAAWCTAQPLGTSLNRLLSDYKIPAGLIVHVGCGDGSTTDGLLQGNRAIVLGLDRAASNISKARDRLSDTGQYGKLSVARWNNLSQLPFTDNLVNLLVIEDMGSLTDREILRVLVPRGVALIKKKRGSRGWRELVKPWPPGMDEWTHWHHGADGNPVSRDVLVGPPRRVQWIDGPSWSKKHWGPRLSAMVSSGGRLLYVQDETPTSLFNIDARWVLIARDAFNGVVLWRKELPQWTRDGWGRVRRRGDDTRETDLVLGVWGELSGGAGVRDATEVMVAGGGKLYVPLTETAPVSAIDANTGTVLHTHAQIAPVKKVVLIDETLVISGPAKVCAIHAPTGRSLWETAGTNASASQGTAYLTDQQGRSIVAIALQSGNRRWETNLEAALQATGGQLASPRDTFNGPLQVGGGVVLAGFGGRRDVQTVAFSTADGKPLWRCDIGDRPFGRGGGPFIIEDLVWTLDAEKGMLTALDPQTGEVQRQVTAPAIRYVGHHARCYLAKATCQYILGKERGADFIDLQSGNVTWNNWLRGPCHRGVLPANGLLYAAQHSCRCYTEAALHGFHALAPADHRRERDQEINRQERPASKTDGRCDSEQLQAGPAYGTVSDQQAERGADSWPTLRHDATRSGATSCEFPREAATQWVKEVGGKLSAPVVASDAVFFAATDRHTLHSLDATTGAPRWQFIAGGRIDSPPTIHRATALFGCRDGWVYCLRLTDGSLVWRFRAAPHDRLVGAHGQLESAWPVPGSILVKDNVAYCVAGRSTYLDDGMYVLALDPGTGQLLHEHHLDGPWPGEETGTSPQTPNRGFTSDGALPDVLVADADHVYLRHLRFDASLQAMEDMQPNVYIPEEWKGENRGGDHKYWDNLLEAPRHANVTDPQWFHRSFFQNFPGRRLYATTGLLDDDGWHRRMYWSYGQVVGQYIVFRGEMGYAVQVFATSPREGGSNAGDGYVVYAGRTAEREEDGEKRFALRPDQSTWRVRVPFRPIAMALAGEQLILAGPPDSADPSKALAAVEGKLGATLCVINAADGTLATHYPLEHAPRYDGLAIASGRCYYTSLDGRVVCLGTTSPDKKSME